MENILARLSSNGQSFSANCPFCVMSGKTKDVKSHLRIVPKQYIYCYRCRYKKSYAWFIARYRIIADRDSYSSSNKKKSEFATSIEFDSLLATLTNDKLDNKSWHDTAMQNYLLQRNITADMYSSFGIRSGRGKLQNRVVFVDYINKYYVARAFLPIVKPKTLNPSSGIRPLMYLHNKSYDTLYMVEGTFDRVPFVKSGKDAVCLLGKDISGNQLQQLKNTKIDNIVICLDPDASSDSIALAQRLADAMPLVNIGVVVYNSDVGGSDPSELDISLFEEACIEWFRIVRPEKQRNITWI